MTPKLKNLLTFWKKPEIPQSNIAALNNKQARRVAALQFTNMPAHIAKELFQGSDRKSSAKVPILDELLNVERTDVSPGVIEALQLAEAPAPFGMSMKQVRELGERAMKSDGLM